MSGKSATRGPRRVGASSSGESARRWRGRRETSPARPLTGAIDDVKEYLYEIKYDGYRVLAAKAGDEVRLITRGGHDWTAPLSDRGAGGPQAPGARGGDRRRGVRRRRGGAPVVPGVAGVARGRAPAGGGDGVARVRDVRSALARRARSTRREIEERRELLEALVAGAPSPLSFSRASTAATREELEGDRRSGARGGARGARREAARVEVHGGIERRVAEAEVRAAAGLRHRRMDPDGGGGERPGGADPRGDGERGAAACGARGDGLRRAHARADPGEARAARDRRGGHRRAADAGGALGDAVAGVRGGVRGVDARGGPAEVELRGVARGQDAGGVHD